MSDENTPWYRMPESHAQAQWTLCLTWGLIYGARTPKGLQRISRANLKLGRRTKDKLAANRHSADVGRRVRAQLKRIEAQLAIFSRNSLGLPQPILHIY